MFVSGYIWSSTKKYSSLGSVSLTYRVKLAISTKTNYSSLVSVSLTCRVKFEIRITVSHCYVFKNDWLNGTWAKFFLLLNIWVTDSILDFTPQEMLPPSHDKMLPHA